jgi:NitT/TauT family transport system ATP-binding protein
MLEAMLSSQETGQPPAAAVTLSEVARVYRTRPRSRRRSSELRALDGVSLTVAGGEVVAIIGPSGCGKTTLLELVCGLQQADAGVLQAEPAALMPQRDVLLPWSSALDNATLALRVQGCSRAVARELATPWFQRLGLGGFEHSDIQAMSGGMRQRVSFLRTLLAGKPVLCLDEPFGALDAITRVQMQEWLAQALAAEDIRTHAVLLVTHDVEEAVLLADRVVVLSARPGTVVATLPVELQRPRRRTDPAFVALRARALAALGMVA